MGIGTDNCFNIKKDSAGRMIPEALEEQIIKCKKEGLFLNIILLLIITGINCRRFSVFCLCNRRNNRLRSVGSNSGDCRHL